MTEDNEDVIKHLEKMWRHIIQLWAVTAILAFIIAVALTLGYL